MNRVIRYFLDKTFVVNLLAFFIFLFGVLALVHTRRDLIPPIEIKSVQIVASIPGAGPLEIERHLAFPIEEAVKNVVGIKKITSTSRDSVAFVVLSFKDDFKQMDGAIEDLRSKVDALKKDLPEETESIEVSQIRVDEVDSLSIALKKVDINSPNDRAWVMRLEETLRAKYGVVRIASSVPKRQVYIRFRLEALKEHALSLSQIRDRIASSMRYLPISSYSNHGKDISIEMASNIVNLDDIASIPIVVNRSGNHVLLRDLANVEFSFPEEKTRTLFDGESYVELNVYKDLASDIIELNRDLRSAIDDYQKIAPKHFEIKIYNDSSFFLSQQLDVLKSNALMGAILVALILYLLLGARISLMTLIGLPFAYFGTFLVLYFLGVSIDLISVVGLILVVGILVDDAIVVSEQYVQNLEKGHNPRRAALLAAKETLVPVSGTVLTTMVAFASMLILSSEASSILFAIPCVVIASLALSWIECYFILPNHLQHFVKSKSKRVDGKLFKKIQLLYQRGLRVVLRFRYLLCFFIVGFLFLTFYVAIAHLEKEFGFSVGNEYLSINFALKKSNSLETTQDALKPIHAMLRAFPQQNIDHLYTRIGDVWRNSRELKGKRYGTIYVQLPFYLKNAKEVRNQLEKDIGSKLSALKTEDFDYLYIQKMTEGDEKKTDDVVTIYVSGRDQFPFEQLQDEISNTVKHVAGVKDVFIDLDKFIETWTFISDPKSLLRYGLSPSLLGLQLRDIFSPQKLMETRVQGENHTVYTEIFSPKEATFEELSKFEVITSQETSVATAFLGRWEKKQILKQVDHENMRRKIEIDVRYNKDISREKLSDQIDRALKPLREKYPVLNFEVIQLSDSEKENRKWLVLVSLLAVGLITFILMLCLNSLTLPFVVISVIPFGVIGVIWALYLHQLPLGIMAMIGIVGMAGVVVNDSLVLVDCINTLKRKATEFEDYSGIIISGAVSRLRPIVMTTLTTLGGVFPMAYGLGGEVGFTRPLAFAMGWGLLFSTLITLFFLPALILILHDAKVFVVRIKMKVLGSFLQRWKA